MEPAAAPTPTPTSAPTPLPTQPPTPASQRHLSARIIGVLAGLIGFAGGRALGLGVIVVLLVVGIPYGLGWWYGQWYGRRPSAKTGWQQFLIWSGLVLWLLPPLGALVAGATGGLGRTGSATARRFHLAGETSALLAFANAILGAYLQTLR